MASLVATAKLNGVEPLAWLTDVLERMVSGRTKAHELERLLPWDWKAERLAGHCRGLTILRQTTLTIVLIRTFLSFSLEVEIEGRWPWQHSAATDKAEALRRSR